MTIYLILRKTKESATILLAVTLSISVLILSYPDTLFAVCDSKCQSVKNQIQNELMDPANKISNQAVVLIYSDTSWSGGISDSSMDYATRDGNGNSKIFMKCDNNGIYSLSVQKDTESGYLLVAVIQDGKLLDSKATTAEYGIAGVAGKCASHGLFGLFS
jgi:hypothetical protein